MDSGEDAEVIDLVAEIDRRGRPPLGGTDRIKFPYRNKSGKPKNCVKNVEVMLKHYGIRVAFNLMSHKVEVTVPGAGVAERRNSIGHAKIRALARSHGLSAGKALEDSLEEIIGSNAYHPVAEWILSRPWDGVARIAELFGTLQLEPEFATEKRLARALRMFRTWLVTGARAAMVPAEAVEGIAAQGVLVLQGKQELGKTRWIMSLLPEGNGWAHEGIQLDTSRRDDIQRATEFFLVELGEIDASIRRSDAAAFKAFITSRSDTYRRAYGRETETAPRRTVYAASVNERCFLVDDTGNRRFWVLPIVGLLVDHGIDMQQVWAEAWSIAQTGADLWMSADDSADVASVNSDHEIDDPLYDQCMKTWERDEEPDESAVQWVDLDEVKRAMDRYRSWSLAESRALARLLRNKMSVKERKVKGYRQFALVRRL